MTTPTRPSSGARSWSFEPARHGADPTRVALATATLLACLAALVAATLLRPRLAAGVRSPVAAKLADSERVAYYLVPPSPEAGPRFHLGPADRSLQLITHLLLPGETRYDPEREYAYALELIVRDLTGRERWRHVLDLRARQSKAGGDRWGWRHENAFLLGDERQLTDDRRTRVRLPPSDEPRTVELRWLPREPSVALAGLARVYVRRPRPVDERALEQLAPGRAAGRIERLTSRTTYRTWGQLSPDERRVALGQVWARLAADGEAGRDYATLGVYETDFRLPRAASLAGVAGSSEAGDAGEGSPARSADRWRSLAYNVLGPAELILRVPPGQAERVELRRLGLDGAVEVYPRSPAPVRRVPIPEGVHTLVVAARQRVEVDLVVADAEAERVALVEPSRPRVVDERGHERLLPDRREVELVALDVDFGPGFGPEHPAPRWPIAGPADAATRTLRFDVRVAAPTASWWPSVGPTPSVELCFLAADERELGCERWRGQASVGSSFEGVRARVDGSELAWAVVSEPQTVRVIAPEQAASVELRPVADAQAAPVRLLVRGYGFWPELAPAIAEPFARYTSTHVRWRYPPLDARPWFPLRPRNYAALSRAGAVVELLAQVRLEPLARPRLGGGPGWSRWLFGDPDLDDALADALAGADGWDPGPWVSVEPWGRHPRREVLERLDDDAGRRLARRWAPSLFSRLRLGRRVRVDLDADLLGPATLLWHVDADALGQTLVVHVGERRFERTLTATRGRWRLRVGDGPGGGGGGDDVVEVGLELDPRGAGAGPRRFWIDRPVVAGPTAVARRRTLHELDPGRGLGFVFRKPDAALTLDLVVYLPRGRERARVRVVVDDGAPRRRAGVAVAHISAPRREFTITREAAFDERGRVVDVRMPTSVIDLAGAGPAVDVVTLPVTVGDDVAAGRHRVRVELITEPGSPERERVWLRAFHRGTARAASLAASWTEPVGQEPR